jgi:hypothetical protein
VSRIRDLIGSLSELIVQPIRLSVTVQQRFFTHGTSDPIGDIQQCDAGATTTTQTLRSFSFCPALPAIFNFLTARKLDNQGNG